MIESNAGSNPASGANIKTNKMDYLEIVEEVLSGKDVSFEVIESIADVVEKANYSVMQVIRFCEQLGNYLGDL